MTTSSNLLRSLVIYAIVLPLALVIGYLLGNNPADFSTQAIIGFVLLVLATPLMLKWHRALLFLTWNAGIVVFFLPTRPEGWLVMAFVSLGIAVVQRTLIQNMRFIYAPSVALPAVFLMAVVVATGYLTKSLGLAVLGSQTIGAKNYLYILAGIAGFFAMMAYRTPVTKANLYTALFFLAPLTNALGTFVPWLPPWCYPIFLFFSIQASDVALLYQTGFETSGHVLRFSGGTTACLFVFSYMLARYGIRNPATKGNGFRLLLLAALGAAGMLGGFRSLFIVLALMFFAVAYLEGLFRSKLAVPFVFTCVTVCVLAVPFADKLPLSIQRSISFLPIKVNPVARLDAESSSQWRVEMWKLLAPQIPRYFWLGKGVGISAHELESFNSTAQTATSSQEEALLVGNYHNGPLTMLLTFGVWGAIGFLWFAGASIRALYLNYRYGEESLQRINTFLLAAFSVKTFVFLFIGGDFRTDFASFTGLIGLGLTLNHGIRKPVFSRLPSKPIPLRPRAQVALSPAR